jgi:hypothetical protein
MKTIEEIAAKVDGLTLDLLGPLRMSKTIDQGALAQLKEALDALGPLWASEEMVSKKLVGNLWFIFTSMLSEAEHARGNREQIEIVAWDIQERLRRLFEPRF